MSGESHGVDLGVLVEAVREGGPRAGILYLLTFMEGWLPVAQAGEQVEDRGLGALRVDDAGDGESL